MAANANIKRRLWQLLQILLTTGVLIWLFHDPQKRTAMAAALGRADWRWLALGWLIAGIGEVAGIARWHLLLQSQKIPAGIGLVARWFFIGLFFNTFLPGTTGGDLARMFYLWRDYPQHRQGAFLTLVADRLIGLVPLILAAGIGVASNFSWLTQTPGTAGLLYGTLIFCAAMGLVILLSFVFSGSDSSVPTWLPAHEKLTSLARAWHLFFSDRRHFYQALALSVPVLFAYYGGFYCSAKSLGAGASLGQIFSIMPIVTVITSLPISVSGLGLREGLFEKLLGDLCGTPSEIASVVSLLGFAIFATYGVIGALVYLYSPKIKRSQLNEMKVTE